jgi:hypothetical protein
MLIIFEKPLHPVDIELGFSRRGQKTALKKFFKL